MKTKTERIVFSKLPAEAKHRLVEELVGWALTVWHAKADDLRGYWLEKKSYETVIYVLRDPEGTLVGSATVKFYKLDFEGTPIEIVKLGLGVDPRFRGHKFALRCLLSELVRYKARSPRTALFAFSTLIHPVTYKLCCDIFKERLYPYYKHPDNPERQRMVEHLAAHFGVEKSPSPSPFVYRELFSARETQEAIDYWRTNQRPEVRFFVNACPDYDKSSDCLIMVAPIELGHMLGHMLRTLAANQLDRLRGRKHQFQ